MEIPSFAQMSEMVGGPGYKPAEARSALSSLDAGWREVERDTVMVAASAMASLEDGRLGPGWTLMRTACESLAGVSEAASRCLRGCQASWPAEAVDLARRAGVSLQGASRLLPGFAAAVVGSRSESLPLLWMRHMESLLACPALGGVSGPVLPYFRICLADQQAAKCSELLHSMDRTVFRMNSRKFAEAREWVRKASGRFDEASRIGCSSETAVQSAVSAFPPPWRDKA